MADFAIIFAYLYLAIAVFAVVYRLYGIVARTLTRNAASRALVEIQKRFTAQDEEFRISAAANFILADNKVHENELDQFAEGALASYITDKNRTIHTLRRAVKEKDQNIRVLGHLLHQTLREKAYLDSVIMRINFDSKSSTFYENALSGFVKHRIEGYATEFSNLISIEFTDAPQSFSSYIGEALQNKIDRQ